MRESEPSSQRHLSLVTAIVCASLVVAVGAIVLWAALQSGGALLLAVPVVVLLAAWVWLVYVVLLAWPLPRPEAARRKMGPGAQMGRAAKLRRRMAERRRACGAVVLWCIVMAAYLLALPHAQALKADGPFLYFTLGVLVPASLCTVYLVMRAAISRRAEHSQDNHQRPENGRRD